MAPARISVGVSPVASTIVEGSPPGVGPPSSTRSTSSPSAAAATSARRLAGDPERFALVATTGKPRRSGQRARHGVVRARGRPRVPVPPCTPGTIVGAASTTSVSGPGQNRPARRRVADGSVVARASTCARSPAMSGSACAAMRPFARYTRATPPACRGSAARPYSVSVGKTTSPPRSRMPAARASAPGSGSVGDTRTLSTPFTLSSTTGRLSGNMRQSDHVPPAAAPPAARRHRRRRQARRRGQQPARPARGVRRNPRRASCSGRPSLNLLGWPVFGGRRRGRPCCRWSATSPRSASSC